MPLNWIITAILLSVTLLPSESRQLTIHATRTLQQFWGLEQSSSERRSEIHRLTTMPDNNFQGDIDDESTIATQSIAKNSKKTGTTSKSPTSQKTKNNIKQSENLGSIWHLYFILMMVATIGGMKLLEREQQRVNRRETSNKDYKTSNDNAQFEHQLNHTIANFE